MNAWRALKRVAAPVLAIAHNTWREAVRDKVFYNLVFFALVLVGFSFFLGEVSIGENARVIKNVGLAAIVLFGVMVAVFVGIGQLNKEMERRTIYTLLAKPVRRWTFILGKYLGLALTLAVEVAALSLGLVLVLLYSVHHLGPNLLPAIGLLYLELLVIAAAALLFVSHSSPFLATLFSLSFFAIGHSTGDLVLFAQRTKNPIIIGLARGFNGLLDLDLFDIRSSCVSGLPLPRDQVTYAVLYGAALIAFLLLVATVLFQRKDLK
jgi:ABC-type transport system involved in multi-copper enzyme maturation permease subunit